MAVKAQALFYKRTDGEGAIICVQIVHFFLMGAMPWCYLCSTLILYQTKLYDYHETNA